MATGRAAVRTYHPGPGRAEQDPGEWWASVVRSAAELRGAIDARGVRSRPPGDRDPAARWADVEGISFSAARETFVPVAADGTCLGAAILWSDRRAGSEAAALADLLGGVEACRQRTGVIMEAGTTAAKVAWITEHEPERLREARWMLAPRDVVVLKMTGTVASDRTLASRTGFYDLDGRELAELAALAAGRLPPVGEPASVVGNLGPPAAQELDLRAGIPVIAGGGDRACEVIGSGATTAEPVVSWGTTANASAPAERTGSAPPAGLSVSAGPAGGVILEAGLSSGGQALEWLGTLTGRAPERLLEEASLAEPGSRGVVALPWLNGARAPWWCAGARAAFLGLTPAHGPGELARSIVEAVAFDVVRGIEAISQLNQEPDRDGGPPRDPGAIRVAGGGAASNLWLDVLTAVADRDAVLLREREVASVGACLLGASALGEAFERERLNPVRGRRKPDPSLVGAYRALRPASDAAAQAVLALSRERVPDVPPLEP